MTADDEVSEDARTTLSETILEEIVGRLDLKPSGGVAGLGAAEAWVDLEHPRGLRLTITVAAGSPEQRHSILQAAVRCQREHANL